jgi:hypothetical protein
MQTHLYWAFQCKPSSNTKQIQREEINAETKSPESSDSGLFVASQNLLTNAGLASDFNDLSILGPIYEFNKGHWSTIAIAETALEDTQISSRTLAITRANF